MWEDDDTVKYMVGLLLLVLVVVSITWFETHMPSRGERFEEGAALRCPWHTTRQQATGVMRETKGVKRDHTLVLYAVQLVMRSAMQVFERQFVVVI